MATKIQSGNDTPGLQNVNTNFQAEVVTEVDVTSNPQFVGAIKNFSEVDAGDITGNYDLLSSETDDDYRQRIAIDTLLDYDSFRTTIQNTGKHTFTFTTLAATMTAAGLTTNSGSITTTTTGLTFGTFAMFPIHPTQTTVCEMSVAFTAQPTANTIVDFGLFQRGATTAFAPLDGVYFRLTSAGLMGVTNSNGSETTTSVFPLSGDTGTWSYTNNTNYRFLIQITNVRVTFWVNNIKLGELPTAAGLNMPFLSQSLPWSLRHAIVGGASGDSTFRAIFGDYRINTRGATYSDSFGAVQARMVGSYQAITGATPGQLIAGTVTSGTLVKPTAAGTLLVQPEYETIFLDAPIYVNPGERIALVGNKTITTAITSGVLSYTYQFIYTWE